MDAAQIGAMAAAQKDSTGPTMMFAQVRPGEAGGSDGDDPITKEQTEAVGTRLQQVSTRILSFRCLAVRRRWSSLS